MLLELARALREGFFMFWETLWPLILGFGLAGAVQAFVSRESMQRKLGDHRPAAVARAAGYGMVSSSCSYAATAMARSLVSKGADFVAAMVFMFASTNLVIELGIVLVVLMGWQFAVSEFAGGIIMIVLLVTAGALWLRGRAVTGARNRAAGGEAAPDHGAPSHAAPGHDHDHGGHGAVPAARGPLRQRLRSGAGWADAASYTMRDLTMLRRELLIGYLVAGLLAVLVPVSGWHALFLTGHGWWTSVENAIVGPFVAMISFVCSIGNVPLAAALWHGGISFGGVIAFLFADLIAFPLLLIYRRYYGTRLMLRLLAIFWAVMAAAGLITEVLFRAAGRARDPADGDRARAVRVELHDVPEHRVPAAVRAPLLAVPQPGPARRRVRVRPGPGVRDAGRDRERAGLGRARRPARVFLLRPLCRPVRPRRDGIIDHMTVVKINAITVPADSGDELARRFAARAGAVDDQDGFEGFELLRPTDQRNTWLVVTRWRDEAAFEAWRTSPAFGRGHGSPAGAGAPSHPHGHGQHGGDHPHGPGGGQSPVAVSSELWSFDIAGGSAEP